MKVRPRFLLNAALFVLAVSLTGIVSSARAEVLSLTLGITTNCPYGLAG